MDKITLVAIAAPVVVAFCGLFFANAQKPSLTVEPAKEKITINVVCVEGYEYIQNTVVGTGAYGIIYTQRFINTDNGLRAKICREPVEKEM